MKLAKYLKFVSLTGAAGLLMASFFAVAQTAAPTVAPAPKPEIESTLTAKRVEIDADKKEKLAEAKSAKPGEVIEYQVIYTNKGKSPVRDLLATLPIPEGTDFQRNTVKPVGAKATVGNGRFESIPLKIGRAHV